ncbi:transcription-repair coupling factor [Acetitomaculum ruminis DSM 5522]|uniref:Transcription-repair-coupling factor n=1 Tax=Acetitomaculum ruminis DSM 5522 TaxID=1120918 RepID=A0A1I0X0N1_9FIRM|nr:transcription-repair coupling factor [Acetitomaculum ruminis]SFA93906.1 transcription-repair coupling factor [Acetitomaculum ruminis DSM 5522]
MQAFVSSLNESEKFRQIKDKIKDNKGIVGIRGCIESQKTHLSYALSKGFKNKIIVTFSESRAREIYEDMQFFDKETCIFPAKDLIFFQADVHSGLITGERMKVLEKIIEKKDVTIVTVIDALITKMIPLNIIKKGIISLAEGDETNLDKLAKQLVLSGYENNYQVEARGQFCLRGGIIDIFPVTFENPIRIELWGDEIDTIRSFNPQSQRSLDDRLEFVNIYPAMEMILDEKIKSKGIESIKKDSKKIYEEFSKKMETEKAYRIKSTCDKLIEDLEEEIELTNLDSYINYFYRETVSFLDYFDKDNTLIFIDEPSKNSEELRLTYEEFNDSSKRRLEMGYNLPLQGDILFDKGNIIHKMNQMNCICLCTIESTRGEWNIKEFFDITVKSINPYNNSFELLISDLLKYKKQKKKVIILSGSKTRAQRLSNELFNREINAYYTEDANRKLNKGEVMVYCGSLKKGFEYPLLDFAIYTESDIFGREAARKKKRNNYKSNSAGIQSFSELSVGDYVVHEGHGLGVYKGIEKIEVEGVKKDYIKIDYANNENLYIPATALHLLTKYASADAAHKPKLNRLNGKEWKKTSSKVRQAVWEVAKDLVELYAKRQKEKGFAFSEDSLWQHEFEEMFAYEETEDQLYAIKETKKDMESDKIMDRLICGDVGFGKTEIAIRAAFKAVQDGKQVAYLVPTTILAGQHYNTFLERMKDFPIRIELMCRFRTPSQIKKSIADLKKGMVDIIIGTHRILSKDVCFKDLGLLIIDEEQRFGVTHKEKIKQLKNNVDVLTLSATPIPRTLHMSLVGIRDMSVLNEAPVDRMPIQTYVLEYDEEMVRKAITRELSRNGQVYYVYNKTKDIDEIAASLSRLVPDARIEYAHGQMSERQLESIMYDFINGEIDILVSTTIIETGLDIPNVNTIIIHDAENFGLSQLYQLRGRVGRSNRTSFAYLLYKRDKILKEVAQKRLLAIREFTELGSGIKIAMKDLEIRGAGNLLGKSQHGHMAAVGYDLYAKMLNEAVLTLKDDKEPEEYYRTVVDINIDAYIPDSYISNEFFKLDMYKRIAGIENEDEYQEMIAELIDRFGDPPNAVINLLDVAIIKEKAHQVYITEISKEPRNIKFSLYEKAKIDVARIPELLEEYGSNIKFVTRTTSPYFLLKLKNKCNEKETLDYIRKFIEALEKIIYSH